MYLILVFSDNALQTTNNKNHLNPPSSKEENPIWELESLCTALHWRPPSYELTDKTPASFHVPKNRYVYTMTCSIRNHMSTGM